MMPIYHTVQQGPVSTNNAVNRATRVGILRISYQAHSQGSETISSHMERVTSVLCIVRALTTVHIRPWRTLLSILEMWVRLRVIKWG
jgi:hypothetical protein